MIRILRQIFRTGIVTEKLPPITDPELEKIGVKLDAVIKRRFQRSLTIRQVDAGSCNGCELEIHALNNAFYALERFGLRFVASPRHADVLLVTGPVMRVVGVTGGAVLGRLLGVLLAALAAQFVIDGIRGAMA